MREQLLKYIPSTVFNQPWIVEVALETFEKLLNAGFRTDAAAYIALGYTFMREPEVNEQEEIMEILHLRYMIRNEFRTIAADRIAMENGVQFKIK